MKKILKCIVIASAVLFILQKQSLAAENTQFKPLYIGVKFTLPNGQPATNLGFAFYCYPPPDGTGPDIKYRGGGGNTTESDGTNYIALWPECRLGDNLVLTYGVYPGCVQTHNLCLEGFTPRSMGKVTDPNMSFDINLKGDGTEIPANIGIVEGTLILPNGKPWVGGEVRVKCGPYNPNDFPYYTGDKTVVTDNHGYYMSYFLENECPINNNYVYGVFFYNYPGCDPKTLDQCDNTSSHFEIARYGGFMNDNVITDRHELPGDPALIPPDATPVPEFNLMTGLVALIGSTGMFYYFRRSRYSRLK